MNEELIKTIIKDVVLNNHLNSNYLEGLISQYVYDRNNESLKINPLILLQAFGQDSVINTIVTFYMVKFGATSMIKDNRIILINFAN